MSTFNSNAADASLSRPSRPDSESMSSSRPDEWVTAMDEAEYLQTRARPPEPSEPSGPSRAPLGPLRAPQLADPGYEHVRRNRSRSHRAEVSGRAETEADKGPGGGAGSVNVAEGTVHDGFVPYQRWKCGRCGRETQDTLAPGPRCCAFPRRVRVPLAADGSAGAEEVHGEVHAVGFVAEAAPP